MTCRSSKKETQKKKEITKTAIKEEPDQHTHAQFINEQEEL